MRALKTIKMCVQIEKHAFYNFNFKNKHIIKPIIGCQASRLYIYIFTWEIKLVVNTVYNICMYFPKIKLFIS